MSEWTIIHHKGSAECTEVMRVPGGRLYRTRIWSKEHGESVALAFAPDPPPQALNVDPRGHTTGTQVNRAYVRT